jgi:outer membrane protein TolC
MELGSRAAPPRRERAFPAPKIRRAHRLHADPHVSGPDPGMSLETGSGVRWLLLLLIGVLAMPARADVGLPAPLRVQDITALARSRRSEIVAARARARAAAQRPAIVSSLDDPTVSISLDHVPFSLMGVEASATFEQAFPLSRVRGHRRRAAEAGARRELERAERAGRDVELEAARAFWMLAQARAAAEIAVRQHALAEQLVAAATARYASTLGAQADVLRAETERDLSLVL